MISYGQVKGRKHNNVQKVYEPPKLEPKPTIQKRMPNAKPVLVDGDWFASVSAAAKALGCSRELLMTRISRNIPYEGHTVKFAKNGGKMEVLEATVIEPKIEVQPAIIRDNLATLEMWVDKQLDPYQGAKLDPNNAKQISEGRKCMADLNKIKKPIEDERKRIKREYEAPLKAFESRVKEITAKIDTARADIKAQVDAADEAFKAERRSALQEEYAGAVGVMADVIPFEAVLDEKWLNRSTPWSKAVDELFDKAQRAVKGYETIKAAPLKHPEEVTKRYCETLDAIGSIEYDNKLVAYDIDMQRFREAQEAAQSVKNSRNGRMEGETQNPPAESITERQRAVKAWIITGEYHGTEKEATEVGKMLARLGVKAMIKEATND